MVPGLTGLTYKPVSFGPIQTRAFQSSCLMYNKPKTGPWPMDSGRSLFQLYSCWTDTPSAGQKKNNGMEASKSKLNIGVLAKLRPRL